MGIYLKDAQGCGNKDMCSTMFTAALSVIGRTWKQLKCSSTKKWIKKVWYIYTMEYNTAENNDILKFADKWMDVEHIILNVIAWPRKKNKICTHS